MRNGPLLIVLMTGGTNKTTHTNTLIIITTTKIENNRTKLFWTSTNCAGRFYTSGFPTWQWREILSIGALGPPVRFNGGDFHAFVDTSSAIIHFIWRTFFWQRQFFFKTVRQSPVLHFVHGLQPVIPSQRPKKEELQDLPTIQTHPNGVAL